MTFSVSRAAPAALSNQVKPEISGPAPDLLLLDANAMGYAAMYQPALTRMAHNGQSTGAIHGLCASIFRLSRLFPSAAPVVLWDGPARWRYGILDTYKNERSIDPEKRAIRESYGSQRAHLRQIFYLLGLMQVGHPDAEADDLAGVLVRALAGRCANRLLGLDHSGRPLRIMLVTTDSDWYQALGPCVDIFNPRVDTLITEQMLLNGEIKGVPGLTPQQYIDAKCMAGDGTDSIEGAPDIGLVTGARVLIEHGSFEALWARADAGETFKGKRMQTLIAPQTRQVFARNRLLMDWRHAPLPDQLAVNALTPDARSLADLLDSFGLSSISRQAQSLLDDGTIERWRLLAPAIESNLNRYLSRSDEIDILDGDSNDMAVSPWARVAQQF